MIAMNDFQAEPEELRRAQLAAADRVIRSGWYVLGKELAAFESGWAARCAAAHAVGVGNGMDALEIGLRALGIGPGHEVITTPMTAFATTLAIMRAGAVPVFADIDADTALLDSASVERCITPRTKAVLLVHLYGRCADMDHWTAFCAAHGLMLLEDCAQAHLSGWKDARAGTFGAFGGFSFYPTKNLGAIGDAGMLVTNDGALADLARRLRNYGQTERYHHPEIGLNSRLDELQAALLSERLKWLDAFTARRKDIAAAYHAGLRNPLVAPLARPARPEAHVNHLFVILCDRRDALAAFLQERGIQSLAHYPIPVHMQKPCLGMARDPKGLPVAESHARRCLSVPCHPQMSDRDVESVIAAANAFG
jgi:dTDP-4-amino-4,6-dideoxygalactose transaminase